MFVTGVVLSEAISWISQSTQLISGAVQLAEQVSRVLEPTNADLSPDERHLLFVIQSYILATIQPLQICCSWSQDRISCVSAVLDQVEAILKDTMGTVHPLLMGQRPVAAASYVARKGQKPRSPAGLPTRPGRSSAQYKSTSSEYALRMNLQRHLQNCAEKLGIAVHLLNMAMHTIQTTELLNREDRRRGSLCLATLLRAHRRFLQLCKCSGDLLVIRGRWLANRKEWYSLKNGETPVDDGQSTAESLQSPSVTEWHWLPGVHEIRIKTQQHKSPGERAVVMAFRSLNYRRRELCEAMGSVETSFITDLISQKGLTLPIDMSRHFRSITVADLGQLPAESDIICATEDRPRVLCGCWTCGSGTNWEPVESPDAEDMASNNSSGGPFEHVWVDAGDEDAERGRAKARRSHRVPIRPPPPTLTQLCPATSSLRSATALRRRSYLRLGSKLLATVGGVRKEDDEATLVFVVDHQSPREFGSQELFPSTAPITSLEFIYFARLLNYAGGAFATSSAASAELGRQGGIEGAFAEYSLDSCSHEVLHQLLSDSNTQ